MNPNETADTRPCGRCDASAEDHGWTGCECLHRHFWAEGTTRATERCSGGCDPHPFVLLDSSSVCPDRMGEFTESEDPRGVM